MKMYAIIEQIKLGDYFEVILDAETEADAIRDGDKEWNHLSAYDRNRREFFAVMYGEVDEEGCFDINSADIVKEWTA